MASYNLSWFQNAFADLQNDLLTPEKLKEIKVALTGLHSSQIGCLVLCLPLKVLFDCLNSFEKRQVENTCDILNIMLSPLPAVAVLQQYQVELARAVKHPEKCVRQTVLQQLCRLEGERDIEVLITKQPSIISDVLELMRDDDLSTAKISINLLTKIGETDCGFKSIICGDTEAFLQILEDSGAVHSLRIYEVMLDIGSKSEDKLSRLESAGLLRGLGKLVTSDDALGKMAAIEELSKLVTTSHGYRFLSRQNCIHVLANELVEAPKSHLFTVVTPGLLKFFGCACQRHAPQIQREYPQVVDTVVSLVSSDNLIISTAAIETVGFICSSFAGKLLLNQTGDAVMMKIAKTMEEMLSKGQVEWKNRILYALANLLHIEDRDLTNNEIVYITHKWFSYLSGSCSGTSLVLSLSKNPFPEVKLAAFTVILKLARLEWGQIEISKHPGALDYLLDRSTETDMAALVAKYDIISTLADSPSSVNIFNEICYSNIIDYKKQGATHVPSKLFVAVEGAE